MLIIGGIVLALCSGVIFPLFMYFWGKQINHSLTDYFVLSSKLDISVHYYITFICMAIVAFIIDGGVFALWKFMSERVGYRFRIRYMEAFTKRKIRWVDSQNLYQTSAQFKLDCLTIQKATGDKVALFYNLIGTVITGVISAICVRWTFALFLIALLPLGMIALGYFIYILIMRQIDSKHFFESAEGQSIQAVSHIKTVKSLGAQYYQQKTYQQKLDRYQEKIKEYPQKLGLATGIFYFIQYFIFGVGFLFGIQCVEGTSACPVSLTGSTYSLGDLHSVFFQIYICVRLIRFLYFQLLFINQLLTSSKKKIQYISKKQDISFILHILLLTNCCQFQFDQRLYFFQDLSYLIKVFYRHCRSLTIEFILQNQRVTFLYSRYI